MSIPEGAHSLGDPSQTLLLFEETAQAENHKDTFRQERRRLIFDYFPELADTDLTVLDALSPAAGVMWLTLVDNLGSPVCRQCTAEKAESRGIKSTSICGNGSSAIRTLINAGFAIESGTCKTLRIPPCADHQSGNLYFDLLVDPLPSEPGQRRAPIPPKLRQRIKTALGGRDAIKNTPIEFSDIQIDHRDTRWEGEEAPIETLTPGELRDRFQTLSIGSNNLKRERCKACKATGIRPLPPGGEGIYYEGSKTFDPTVGCRGCFFFDPDTWRGHRKVFADRGQGIVSPLGPEISTGTDSRPHLVVATSRGPCPRCSQQINPGSHISPDSEDQWAHTHCPDVSSEDDTGTLSLFTELPPAR